MYFVELTFGVLERGATEAKEDAVWSLTGSFVRNGNLQKDIAITKGPEEWTIRGLAPAKDAFQRKNWNKNVLKGIMATREAGLSRPQIRFVGIALDTSSVCRCDKPNGYFLFTTLMHLGSPVRCLRCGDAVPLYRLPHTEDEDLGGLLTWESDYQACDTLQMNCGFGERYGLRQMSDLESGLSRSGRKICREIEKSTGCPTYYYLHKYNARSYSAELRRKCPGCGGSWSLEEPLHQTFDFQCDKCRLLSNIARDVRSRIE